MQQINFRRNKFRFALHISVFQKIITSMKIHFAAQLALLLLAPKSHWGTVSFKNFLKEILCNSETKMHGN